MPNDFLTLYNLTKELDKQLRGGKIEKINQPERDEIFLTIRSLGNKYNLAVSCCAETPRINITNIKKENPYQAPAFCMHLRKLIGNGFIESISLYNNDRIIDIAIVAKNELKDTIKFNLIFEMMGRYSNVLLVDANKIILDAIKQVSYDTATKRCILPGMPYSAPEQNKILPFDTDAIKNKIKEYGGGNLAKFLTANVSGLSLISGDEIVYRAKIEHSERLTEEEIRCVLAKYNELYSAFENGIYSPCSVISNNSKLNDYYITPYKVLNIENSNEKMRLEIHKSLSEAIENCIGEKINNERHREKTKYLINAVKKYRARNIKKLQKANEKLEECSKIDTYRIYGELINCNLHLIKKGMDSVKVTNFYDENQDLITIPLNPLLNASENAQAYFKKYNKLKRTKSVVSDMLDDMRECIEHSESIEASLETSNSTSEILQIEEELFSIGALKKIKTKINKSAPKASPFIYEYENFVIMVGKNNVQNDKLTFKTANGGDLWLHALGYHGSHVIVFSETRNIPDNVVQFACELAAYYSAAKSDSIQIDYTYRRNVKRNPSGKLGLVSYTDQNTALVKPNQHLEYLKQ